MKRYIVLLMLSAIVISSGCSKKRQSYLYGKWLEETRVANSSEKHVWNFDGAESTFSIEFFEKDSTGEFVLMGVITGDFSFKHKNFNDYITLNMDRRVDRFLVNGEYWVDDISRTLLTMTREKFKDSVSTGTPFRRLEFTKE